MSLKISKPSRQQVLREIQDYVLIAFGMILYGIGWTIFLLPNEITVGGLPGIASIVYWATGLPVQYLYTTVNAILLLISIKILGLRFSIKTVFAVLSLSLFLMVIPHFTDDTVLFKDEVFLSCVLGATLCGVGIGITFSAHGSSGGTDIIAAIINKYYDISLGRAIMFLNMAIVTASYFVLKDWSQVVYGFITLYVMSFVLDKILDSGRSDVQFFIISPKYEEISRKINALHRGVTIIDAVGSYTGNPQKMMFVLAKLSQSNTIFAIINDIDPTAFISQSKVIGVYGEGFSTLKVKSKENKKLKIAASKA